jgi:hypothetical protein
VAIASEGLADWPEHPSLNYQLACYEALQGHRDQAIAHLKIAFANKRGPRASGPPATRTSSRSATTRRSLEPVRVTGQSREPRNPGARRPLALVMTPRRSIPAALLAALLLPAAVADAKAPSCTRGGFALEQASGKVRIVTRTLKTESPQQTRREGRQRLLGATGKRFRIAPSRTSATTCARARASRSSTSATSASC